MKRKIFLLPLILALALLFSLFSLTALAKDTEALTSADATEQTESEEAVQLGSGTANTQENIFSLAYERICSYSTEIFSAMTLICSVIVIFFYKKGILPVLKGGIGALSTTVKSIKESSKEQSDALSSFATETDKRIETANSILEKAALSLEELTKKLQSAEEAKKSSEVIKSVLLSEVDMLYDIFMSASLPQYEKDRIGERVAAMKTSLASEAALNEA